MNTRRLLAAIAIPVIVGTFGCVALNQAAAQSPNRLAQNSSQPNQQQEGRRNHRGPDFAAAAQKLGITEAKLKEALGVPTNPQATPGQRPPRPDFKAAAAKLGITEQQLVDALGIPPRPPRPDFAAAAQKLGVSEANLKAALGVPANPPSTPPTPGQRPPRPDFKAAAAKLGVTEEQLVNALGIPPRPPQNGNQPDGSRSPQQ
jgi:membrane-bound lytic murein transglycosylase B